MNISELARILRISPQELRDKLPQLGFDIGQKAIKIDDRTANKIISQWSGLIKKLASEEKEASGEQTKKEAAVNLKKEITIPPFITVRDFSSLLDMPVNKILAELMKSGIFSSLNERIDFETAAIIGADLGVEVKLTEGWQETGIDQSKRLDSVLAKEKKGDLKLRPPVIVVMGHVDHGKTKLLDAIRRTNVVDEEAGGITQHIGAYQIERKNKTITFIDTPGHEAFTAMRSRGAKIADIAILVVAADDGVKPQTVEAFRIIEAAKLPYLVAINKIDKTEANIDKAKQELSSQLKIVPEDWGGKAVCVPVSAKENKGIEELLDVIVFMAELEADNIVANPAAEAVGTIIESRVDKGEGPVATVLIQNGTLRLGDQICFNNNICGRARALKNFRGETIKEASPGTPVKIVGLKIAPAIGDILETGEGQKLKMKNIKSGYFNRDFTATEQPEDEQAKKIKLIIKSDVLGSAEAIEESLEKINTREVKTKIIAKGLGNITDGDVTRAEASDARILGFNVKITSGADELAREKKVEIKLYNIIYDLINDIKKEMQSLLEPEIKRVDLGRLKVKAIFKTGENDQIVGGRVAEGKAVNNTLIEVERNKEIIARGSINQLQSAKQTVDSVEAGQECGVNYQGRPVIKEGDTLIFYREEKISKKL